MDLRALKKEVHSLPCVKVNLKGFKDNWLKQLKSNDQSWQQNLSPEFKKELKQKLASLNLRNIDEGINVQEKLKLYARYLIELKLTTIQDDPRKAKMITNRLLNDDLFNFKQTINDVKSFETNVNHLIKQYDEVNQMLHKELSLENTLQLMDLPHKIYLYSLLKTSQKQKKIVRKLGQNFVSLAKETRKISHR